MRRAVEADVVERIGGMLAHDRFGVVGDADAGIGHHDEVVGAVADGNDLRLFETELHALAIEPVGLGLRIDDVAEHTTGELAADDFQSVRRGVVEAGQIFNPMRRRRLSANSISPRIAASVIAATSALSPCMSAISSMHSIVISVESMSISTRPKLSSVW